MRVTTLIDNRPAPQLTAEWGLAFWIEYQDKHILLDTGGGESFARNAAALGIYLSRQSRSPGASLSTPPMRCTRSMSD